MPKQIYVVPGEGRTVPLALVNRRPGNVPATGCTVPRTGFVMRLLRDGDLIETKPPVAPTAAIEQSPAAPPPASPATAPTPAPAATPSK